MEISVREAATLLGRSRRTVRAQLARGELPGRKRSGRWRVDRRHLPLTEAQHRALQRRADDVRQAVDAVLPSRQAGDAGDRSRSVLGGWLRRLKRPDSPSDDSEGKDLPREACDPGW